MTGALSSVWEQGLCIRCKEKREQGNETFWCNSCAEQDRLTHTRTLSI